MSGANAISDNQPQQALDDTLTHQSPIQPDDFFNFNLISFQVGTTVFRVLTHGIVIPGSAFEVMLSLPNADHEEGSTNEKPILLEGVQEKHFRAFLRVVYGDFGKQIRHVVDFDDWVGVLNLATMWSFQEVRAKAVEELSKLLPNRSLPEKLHLGRKYMIDGWMRDALVGLVQQNPLDLDELTMLGSPFALDWKTVAKIFRIREELSKRPSLQFCNTCGQMYQESISHWCVGRPRWDISVPSKPEPIRKENQQEEDLVNKFFKDDFSKPRTDA